MCLLLLHTERWNKKMHYLNRVTGNKYALLLVKWLHSESLIGPYVSCGVMNTPSWMVIVGLFLDDRSSGRLYYKFEIIQSLCKCNTHQPREREYISRWLTCNLSYQFTESQISLHPPNENFRWMNGHCTLGRQERWQIALLEIWTNIILM